MAKQRADPAGYVRATVGPAGHGKLVYAQDIAVGKPTGLGKRGLVADHKNGVRSDNSKGNVRLVSRSVNRTNQHPSLTPHPKRKGK